MALHSIEVLRPGTEVILADGIDGVIVGVILSGSPITISYDVAWWNGRVRVQQEVQNFEIVKDKGKEDRVFIGFGSKR